ncbi:MAG: ferrochelatase [Chloroherpetonaceae bacterium]|nr:ferrochelatase [Chloroherpetonaceae bacterium]
MTKRKVSVILATYGEVEEPTIKNLLPNSKRILKYITTRIAKIPRPIVELIAWTRSFKRKKYWNNLGYRSKLNALTRNQASKLQSVLKGDSEIDFKVADSYYFVPPYLENTLTVHRNSDAIVLVPMIPIESDFSCGVGCVITTDTFKESAFGKVVVLKHFWNDTELLQVYANHIFSNLQNSEKATKLGLALAVHGTLVKGTDGLPPKANTGYKETLQFFTQLKSFLENDPRNRFHAIKLGCLNHVYGGEWTPETLAIALEEFKSEGIEKVAVFPFGFFADNSEADLEAVEETENAGYRGSKMQYIPCVNDSDEFIHWVAKRVKRSANHLLQMNSSLDALSQKQIQTPVY